jgi:N-acetylglucosaminyl-diphospho-decaprenol L-rhamnosyltransferase
LASDNARLSAMPHALRLSADVIFDLSVVIVSYNTKDITIACIASVLAGKGALSLEMIVVDNCSSDGSAEAIRAAFPDIVVIDSPANGGFAYGNNIGLERCHGAYVLMLNPDTEVIGDCLTLAVDYLKTNPEIGMLGAQIRYPSGDAQNSMIRFLSLKTLFFLTFLPSRIVVGHPMMGDHRYGSLSPEAINRVDCVMGSFMMVPRATLQAVGGLDHRFFMYGEECEFCHRIGRAGKQVVYFPPAKIIHHSGASTEGRSVWQATEMARGHILFLRFTRGVTTAWLGTLLMTIRDSVRIPYYAAQTMWRGGKPSDMAAAWWTRLKFLCGALVRLPAGQSVRLPDPD